MTDRRRKFTGAENDAQKNAVTKRNKTPCPESIGQKANTARHQTNPTPFSSPIKPVSRATKGRADEARAK
jgi:hypothetical protein